MVGWAFSKRSAKCIKKIKTKKACVVVLIYPSVCGGSQHCYNPGRAIPNLITVNSRRAHKCIHFNPEEDSPVSKSVSPRIVSSLNDRNPFVREGGGRRRLPFLPRSGNSLPPLLLLKQTKKLKSQNFLKYNRCTAKQSS